MKFFTYKRFFLLLGVVFFVSYFTSKMLVSVYPVTELYAYQDVEKEIELCDKQTLILFDVDDTLISTYHDVVARGTYYPWWYVVLAFLKFPHFIKKQNYEQAYSIVLTQAERVVIDPFVKHLIREFKKKSMVLGLTSLETGSFGSIQDLAIWRYQMLDELGIRFTRDFMNIKFTNLSSHRGNYPELYNGILYTNHRPKGELLGAFLYHADLQPSKIILFDDKMYNLQSVGRFCKKHNIPCKLYHVRIIDRWPHDWDFSKIFKQIKILSEQKRWVSIQDLS